MSITKENSGLENLLKGRGTKKKLGHKSYSVKLSPSEKKRVEDIAESFDCTYGNSGSISCLLTKLATKELMVVSSPPIWEKSPCHSEATSDKSKVLPDPKSVMQRSLPGISKEKLEKANSGHTDEAISIRKN
ncbi:hypothetical protein S7335_746 [Synechococcus sp. PCC 7335]|uniref:hypothetical protein n=1 Tax=Synechococcus sp. (strain ATCC 29403 / PCC 7335) TaxID=91464 RepID=UPI00017EBC9E|nr:hypothetical protein [Synechococcus sp. PCC 7335]EDX83427.1 hypothetical protein S7335_607 [Synechococcus sp. PCC 7335]EDX83566.1 hypothetical protein S7335_746 [Synechococcus sp. PCC 7335]